MGQQFEADRDPETGWPRLRFNFANGWSASIVVRTNAGGCDALIASVAACPTGGWGTGKTILGPTEAIADEAVAWMELVRCASTGTSPHELSKYLGAELRPQIVTSDHLAA